MAAWVPDSFCNFYLVKSHKIANNSSTTEAGEKIIVDLESVEFSKFLNMCLTKFENYQIYLIKLATDF